MSVESLHDLGQVGGGELPVEGLRRAWLSRFSKGGEPFDDDVEIIEIVGREYFSLDDGEDDLHLINHDACTGGVHQDGVGELFGEPVDRLLTAVGRAVVNNPKHGIPSASPRQFSVKYSGLPEPAASSTPAVMPA